MCGSKCREFKLFTFLAVQFMGHYAAVKTFRIEQPPLEDRNVCPLKTLVIEKDFGCSAGFIKSTREQRGNGIFTLRKAF